MKVHKTTSDRIYFQMDSGAYGSIAKTDVSKLVTAVDLPNGHIDARVGECMVELINANDTRSSDSDRLGGMFGGMSPKGERGEYGERL
jgi:hypothetical protein